MKVINEIIKILGTSGKWDYAKLAQIVKLLGGVKKALWIFGIFAAGVGIAIFEGGKKLIKTIADKNKSASPEKQQEIQRMTNAYLSAVEKRKQNGQDTKDLDLKYNAYMESALNETGE